MRKIPLWIVFFSFVAVCFPLSSFSVFVLQANRKLIADMMSCIYSVGIFAGLMSSFFHKSDCSLKVRLEYFTKIYLGMSYFTHLTWEFGWLAVFRRYPIEFTKNNAWFFAWWMYIDGFPQIFKQNINKKNLFSFIFI